MTSEPYVCDLSSGRAESFLSKMKRSGSDVFQRLPTSILGSRMAANGVTENQEEMDELSWCIPMFLRQGSIVIVLLNAHNNL